MSFEEIIKIVEGLSEDNIKAILKNYMKEVKFTEEFMREYIDLFDRGELFIFQNVSKDFIREFVTRDCLIHILFGVSGISEDNAFRKEIEERFYDRRKSR